MTDDDHPSVRSAAEPIYEPIGPGSGGSGWEDDDGGGPGGAPEVRLVFRPAWEDLTRSVRTFRFWTLAGGAVLGTWAASAAAVAMLPSTGQGSDGFNALLLVYALAATLMPAVAAFVVVHWGMHCYGQIAAAGAPAAGGGLLPALLATASRGLVLAALVLCVLLLQALVAGGSGAVAAAAAAVTAVEGAVFGALGVGVSAAAGDSRPGRVAGWVLAALLVAGSAAAAAALVPSVRAVEPVTVALNVEWGPAGTRQAYECSPVPAGVAEVHHTERVMWLAAISPSVVFLTLGADADPAGAVLGWVPAALREAADGTGVPCVRGEPRAKDSPRMPLPVVGVAGQALVAGALLAAGRKAAVSRRRPRA